MLDHLLQFFQKKVEVPSAFLVYRSTIRCYFQKISIMRLIQYNHFLIDMSQRIKVIVRPRPLPKDQIQNLISIDYSAHLITLKKVNDKMQHLLPKDNAVRAFAFSKVFSQHASQQEVYEQSAFSLVENVLEGYNGTIFAYGQTGSGKTFSLMGGKQFMQRKISNKKQNFSNDQQDVSSKNNQINTYIDGLKGIIPRSFNQIIAVTNSQKNKKHLITCSFIEIYNENVHDLLAEDTKCNLPLKENATKGLVIQGLKTFIVKNVEELEKHFKFGYRNRSVRQTTMNKQSSRSHCIFTIKIEQESTDQNGNTKFKVGKLNLVDLAGSQRQKKTNSKDQAIKQAVKINLSLSALGKVINCLYNFRQNQKNYIPYRDSKLTRILQDSLGGNTKTVMIAAISVSSQNYEETLSTLIYASRAKYIQNTPVLNQDPKDMLLREYMEQIKKLKVLLMQKELENQDLKSTFVRNQPIKSIQSLVQQRQIQKIQLQQQQIKKKIQVLQNIVKKQTVDNEEVKIELQKIEYLKRKIKLQEQRQFQLEKQKKQKEQELLLIQKDYQTLNQEVDILRNKFKDLKSKYLLKCEEYDDLKSEYNDEKDEFHYILKQKDKQIKKLQKLLSSVLQEHRHREVVDEDEQSSVTENQSNYSTKKMFNSIKPQNKANNAKFNNPNLFKGQISECQIEEEKKTRYNKMEAPRHRIITQQKIPLKSYESEHEKRKTKNEQRSSYTSLKMIDKQKQKRERIKKVDSLISLKPKNQVKLPFVTQVKKVISNKRINSPDKKSSYIKKFGLDIDQIKNQILNDLKAGKSRNH